MAYGDDEIERMIPVEFEIIDLKRKRNERIYITVIVILLLTLIGLLAAVIVLSGRPKSMETVPAAQTVREPDICRNASCLTAAAGIIANMDRTVDPCKDFYRFACGGWMKRRSIPPDRFEVSVFGALEDRHEERLREALSAPLSNNDTTSAESKMKAFFSSCLRTYGRLAGRENPVIAAIKNTVQGWYVLDPQNWNQNWNMTDAMSALIGKFHVPVFFNYEGTYDPRFPYNHILSFFPSGIGPPVRYYRKSLEKKEIPPELVPPYKLFIRKVASLLLRDSSIAIDAAEKKQRLDQFVNDVIKAELQLADMFSRSSSVLSKEVYETAIVTLAELNYHFNQTDFVTLMRSMFPKMYIPARTYVVVVAIPYFEKLNNWLITLENKDRVLNNYMVWRLAVTHLPHMAYDYIQAWQQFGQIFHGTQEIPSAWQSCIESMMQLFPVGVAAEFSRTHLGDEAIYQATSVFVEAQKALVQRIHELPWMDRETRLRAEGKVKTIKGFIGFPKFVSNFTLIDIMYTNLSISEDDSYFTNYFKVLNFFKFNIGIILMKKGGSKELVEFSLPEVAFDVSIWYYNIIHTLYISPGAQRPPMFSEAAPNVVNIGALGSAIATEITKSPWMIDKSLWWAGRTTWWTNSTIEAYKPLDNCLTSFYNGQNLGSFFVEGENRTLPLNVGRNRWDLVRYTLSYAVALTMYRNSVRQGQSHGALPGLQMTNEQTVLVAAAQRQCFLRRDKATYRLIENAIVPEDLRVNGGLSQLPEFANIFRCDTNSKMVLNSTCNILKTR